MNQDTHSDWKHNPVIIGLLLLFCFPIGLILAWIHPTWEQRTKWIITGVLALCAAIGGIQSEREKASNSKKQVIASANRQNSPSISDTATSDKPIIAQPDISVTATDMATTKSSNDLRFDSQYENKLIQVTGVVKGIQKAMFGEPYVTLEGTEQYHIVCYCVTDDRAALEKLSPGDQVTLIGNYATTVLFGIWMKDCRLVSPTSVAENANTSSHPKLIAFLELIEKYKQSPQAPLTSDSDRRRFIKEIEPLQKAFRDIQFDPTMHPEVARKMIDIFQQSVYQQYSGSLYNEFEAEIFEMTAQLVER